LFISCDSFLSGALLQEEMNELIKFNKADPVDAVIEKYNIDDNGSLLPSGQIQEKKVGYAFDISYTQSTSYCFVYWQSVDENGNVSSESEVEFEDKYATKTSVTVLTPNPIKIQAVAVKRPSVIASSTTPNQGQTVCKDTNLLIYFDKDLSPENDLSQIQLIYGGNRLSFGEQEPFGNPYFYTNEENVTFYNQIIIPAHTKYALPLEVGSTSSIQVILPEQLYYVEAQSNKKIYLNTTEGTNSWTYKITGDTNTKNQITVKTTPGAGLLTGESGEYQIGSSVEFTFATDESAKFLGWEITKFPLDCADETITTEDGKEKLILAINDKGSINIEAQSEFRKQITIKLDGKNGRFNTIESKKYYKDDVLNLTFTPDDSYGFVQWKFFDSNNSEIADIASILKEEVVVKDSTYVETIFTVLDDNQDIRIEAVTDIRPKILLGTPEYNSNGVNRDSRIRVLFNQNMRQNDESYNIKDYITITNLVTGEDYLSEYYEEPQFVNEKTLIIKAKEDHLPPEASEVSVDINKDIQNKNGIGLKENYTWMFFVGREVDETAPLFKSLTVVGMKNDAEEDTSIYSSTFGSDKISSLTNKLFAKYKLIKLNATILDEGSSNVGCFYVDVIKVRDTEGNVVSDSIINTVVCPVLSVVGAEAQCNNWIINTEEDLGITDNGTYRLEFHADDNSGNTRKYGDLVKDSSNNVLQPANDPIHLVGDYVLPVWDSFDIQCKAYDGTLKSLGTTQLSDITNNVDDFRNAYCSDNNLYLIYSASDNNNIQRIDLVYKRITDTNYNTLDAELVSEVAETINTLNPMLNTVNTTQTVDVRSLIMGTSTESKDGVYSCYFKVYDAVGLSTRITNTYYFVIDKTPPAADYSPLYQRTTENSICLYSSGFPYDVRNAFLKVDNGEYKEFSRNAGRGKIDGLSSVTEYEVSIYYIDYFDNTSEPGTRTIKTAKSATQVDSVSAGDNATIYAPFAYNGDGSTVYRTVNIVTNTKEKITLSQPEEVELIGYGPSASSCSTLYYPSRYNGVTKPVFQWYKSNDGVNWEKLGSESNDSYCITITPPLGITYYALWCKTGTSGSYTKEGYSSVTTISCGVGATKDSPGWIAYSDNSITDLDHYDSTKTAIGVVVWSEIEDDGKERLIILRPYSKYYNIHKTAYSSNSESMWNINDTDGHNITASFKSQTNMLAFNYVAGLDNAGLSSGDFWFIPSTDQFNQMVTNLELFRESYIKIGGCAETFSSNYYYWLADCSKHGNASQGGVMNFEGSTEIKSYSNVNYICPIARFYEAD